MAKLHTYIPQKLCFLCSSKAILSDEDVGDPLDAVDALIRKHDDFAKSFAAQEDKIKDIDETATKLIDNEHYASDDIDERRNEVSIL